MTAPKLRVGVVSANWGMSAHLPAWHATGEAEVVAVCTSRRETAERAAATHGIDRAYWDAAEMAADADIDVIDVGTRPDLRAPMILAAIANGKHVFASANFAPDLATARKMRDAAREAGVVGALDSVFCWQPAHRHAHALLEAGAIGRPVAVATQLNIGLFGPPDGVGSHWRWFGTKRHGASALRNLGTHTLNLLVHLLGPIEAVAGHSTIALPAWHFADGEVIRPEVDDTAQLLLRFGSGVLGSMTVSWSSPGQSGWRMELTGDKATLVTRDEHGFPSGPTVTLHRGEAAGALRPVDLPADLIAPPGISFAQPPGPPQAHDIAAAMKDMIRAIRKGGGALPSFDQAFHVEAVLDAAQRAIDTRCWVDVPR